MKAIWGVVGAWLGLLAIPYAWGMGKSIPPTVKAPSTPGSVSSSAPPSVPLPPLPAAATSSVPVVPKPAWTLLPVFNDLIKGRDLWLDGKNDAALAHFAEMGKKYPDSVAGPVGRMAFWTMRMMETSSLRHRQEYLAAYENYKTVRRNHIITDPAARRLQHFLLAAGEGLHGFYSVLSANYLDGLFYSLRGLSQMEEIYYEDRTFTDSLIGIGAMKYAKGVIRQKTALGFLLGDKMEEGLADLRKAGETGPLTQPLVPYLLAFIFEREHNYPQAEKEIDPAVRRAPNNCLIGELKANILINSRQTQAAMAQLGHLLTQGCDRPIIDYKFGFLHFYQTSDHAQAEKRLSASLAGDFFNLKPPPDYILGEIALERGRAEEAQRYFRRSFDRYGDDQSRMRLKQVKEN